MDVFAYIEDVSVKYGWIRDLTDEQKDDLAKIILESRFEECEHRYAFLVPGGRGLMRCSDCGEEI